MSENQIIPRYTAEEMVASYEQAAETVRQAYSQLEQAEQQLMQVFGRYNGHASFDLLPDRHASFHYGGGSKAIAEAIDKRIRRGAWNCIINAMGFRKLASTKRWDELQKQLDEKPPELNVAAIYDLLQATVQNQQEIALEVVKEAYEYLRPYGSHYETNKKNKWVLGKKVILTGALQHGYGNSRFTVNHYRRQNLLVVDRVFHLLAGKQMGDEYSGELIQSIETSKEGKGETTFFKWQGYHNQNLHIEFKSAELVAKFNLAAGNGTLPGQHYERKQQASMF